MDHIELIIMARTKSAQLVEGMPICYDAETVGESDNMKKAFCIVKAPLSLIDNLRDTYLPAVMDDMTTIFEHAYKLSLDALATALGDPSLADKWRDDTILVEIANGLEINWDSLFIEVE